MPKRSQLQSMKNRKLQNLVIMKRIEMKYEFSNAMCEEKRYLKIFITLLLTKCMLKEILNRTHDTKKNE